MKDIRLTIGRQLQWAQPSAMKREFELRDGEELVATLRFRSSLGSLATVQASEGSWTFKRVGFWSTRVTICPAGSEEEIAVFRNATWHGGGTLELPDGRQFRASTNFWMTRYDFVDSADQRLVQFTRIRGAFHHSAQVEIAEAAAKLAELPWMVALGWYLAIKMRDDASGAAAGAAAAAG
jgi:hypothetical protein